jgi:hypothetical protein
MTPVDRVNWRLVFIAVAVILMTVLMAQPHTHIPGMRQLLTRNGL